MKQVFLFISALLLFSEIIAQDIPELQLTKDGVEPIQISFDELSSVELYSKTLEWVNATYKSPKDALKTKNPYSEVLIEGYHRKAWWYKSMGIKNFNHMLYKVHLELKDNLITLNYEVGQFYLDEDVKVQYDYRMFFKKDGTIRNQYSDAVTSLEYTMNNLVVSLYNFITGKEIAFENKDLNKYFNSAYKNLAKNPLDPNAHFEMACLYSLLEDSEKSYNHLSKAISLGYKKTKRIIKEPDLNWLRQQPDYNSFVKNNYKLNTTNNNNSYISELKELAKLREEGVLTEEEFKDLKTKLINSVKQQ